MEPTPIPERQTGAVAHQISTSHPLNFIPSMKTPEIRWIQRFDNFKRAFARLSEASGLAGQLDLSDLERQGLIQAFTGEL